MTAKLLRGKAHQGAFCRIRRLCCTPLHLRDRVSLKAGLRLRGSRNITGHDAAVKSCYALPERTTNVFIACVLALVIQNHGRQR